MTEDTTKLIASYEHARTEKSKELKKIYSEIQKLSVQASMLAGAVQQLNDLIKDAKGESNEIPQKTSNN